MLVIFGRRKVIFVFVVFLIFSWMEICRCWFLGFCWSEIIIGFSGIKAILLVVKGIVLLCLVVFGRISLCEIVRKVFVLRVVVVMIEISSIW